MRESAKRHKENSNLIKEIRASTDVAIRNQGASIKTLEIQIRQMSKVLQERGFKSLCNSTKANQRDRVKSISTIIEVDSYPIRRIGSSQYAVSIGQNRTLMYKTKQTTILFLSRLNGYYCEENKGSHGLQFSKAYSEASHINKSIPRKEKDPGSFTLSFFINNVCFNNALADLGASVSVMPLSTYLNLGLGELVHTKLTVELVDSIVKYPKEIAENVLVGIGKFVFPIDFTILDMPEDVKVPLILGRPFLSTAHAKIDVFKKEITLRVGEEKIIFKSVKPASSLIKRVYMLSLRETIELDLKVRLMGETLMLNRSLDPFFGDYIELNNLNVPIELRRDHVDNLLPIIKEGGVVEEFGARNDARMHPIVTFPLRPDFGGVTDGTRAKPDTPGRAYVVVENPQQNPNVVTGTFLLNDHYACILFDSGAEKSFVSSAFTHFINITPATLNTSYEVELADGKVVSTNTILRSCTLVLLNHVFKIDLLPTRLGSFDVIIGMDWLAYHRALIDCYEKIVRIPLPNGKILEVQGERPEKDLRSLACIKADEKKLDDIRVVRDFPEVFPDDLLGLPLVREIEFRIDLIPGASPVVRSPYRLAPSEMLELSNQLKEL
ncbi:mitochondrial proton/calcium exchanger protein-like protein isoform X1 [Tanacetum coccineum]